jgi:hypothetical protein
MRALIEFDGSVSAQRSSGPVGLSLRGAVAPGSALPRATVLELLFSGVAPTPPAIPASLHAVQVVQLEPDLPPPSPGSPMQHGGRRFRIDAREGHYSVHARSVQLHAQASGAFFAVLPRTRVAPMRRWGWSALLALLRVPSVARLLTRRA